MKSQSQTQKWYKIKQNHNSGYKMMRFCLKIFPPAFVRALAFFIGFFYWLFGAKTRRVSKEYLKKVKKFRHSEFISESASNDKSRFQNKFTMTNGSTLKHIISFALNLVEDVQSWAGNFSFADVDWQNDDVDDLVKNINEGKGTVILISHLGNAMMMKGLASLGEAGTKRKMSITTISDADISAGFNSLLNEINSDSSFHIINSNDIGPETILILQERLEKGETVVIAGDRVSAHTDRNIRIKFLGEEADFPYGVFLLVALLNSPTYFVNGLRHKDFSLKPKYDMFVKKNDVTFDCTRKEREARIKKSAENYVANLEKLCLLHPYQWYNFFDFWS